MATKPSKFSKKTLLAFMRETGRPIRNKDIYGLFGANAALKKTIKSALAQMAQSGELVPVGKGHALPETLPRIVGTLDVRRSGVGYLIPEDRLKKDISSIHPSSAGPGPETRSRP